MMETTEPSWAVTALAVQMSGAHGTMVSVPFSHYLRDAKNYEIAGGSAEILKKTIGRHLLRRVAS